MGAAFAGIIRIPMTSVIMIFEVTRDYSIIVPLMISNLISFFISSRLQPEPIYEALSRQDGVHLPAGETRARHGAIRVAHAMRSPFHPVRPEATVSAALDDIRALGVHTWPVADGKQLLGMITTARLESAASDGLHEKTVTEILPSLPQAALNAEHFPHVHIDHSLDLALQRMGEAYLDVLPVFGRDDVRELLGVIFLPDTLRVYGIGNTPRNNDS